MLYYISSLRLLCKFPPVIQFPKHILPNWGKIRHVFPLPTIIFRARLRGKGSISPPLPPPPPRNFSAIPHLVASFESKRNMKGIKIQISPFPPFRFTSAITSFCLKVEEGRKKTKSGKLAMMTREKIVTFRGNRIFRPK